MKDLNNLTIIGRLTKDAEMRYTAGGMAIASLSIANNRSKKDGDQWVDETSFFSVTVFGKTAENLKQYLTKGKQVAITGSIKQERWEKDGKQESRVIIIADDIQLIGGQNQNAQPQGNYNQQREPQQNYQRNNAPQPNYGYNNVPPQVQAVQQTFGGFIEDVPF